MPPSVSRVRANRSSVAATTCGGQLGQRLDGFDRAGEQGVDHAAQLDGHPGPEALGHVAVHEDLVVAEDAGAQVGLQLRAR